MQLVLSTVDPDDAERLIRECDFPAMRSNPLHLLMYPHSSEKTEEEEIQWSIKGLRETLQTRSAEFRKVCLEDGTPVGFAGWSLEQTSEDKDIDKKSIVKERTQPNKRPKDDYWHPDTLDVESWVSVSKIFRQEKRRVLANRKNIWSLNMISVNPAYQCQGIGSVLMQWGTQEADVHGRDSFLISSPAGIHLYAKFGFKIVGKVNTPTGTFTIIIAMAHQKIIKPEIEGLPRSPPAGCLSLGSLPPVYFNKSFTSTPILPGCEWDDSPNVYYFYFIEVDSLNLNGKALANSSSGKSSNYTVNYFPLFNYYSPRFASIINAAFDPPAIHNKIRGLYIVDCNTTAPAHSVTINGTEFAINPLDMIVYMEDSICVSGVQSSEDIFDWWILGLPFLTNVVTVYNLAAYEIRFAPHVDHTSKDPH